MPEHVRTEVGATDDAKGSFPIRPEDVERKYKLEYLYSREDPSRKIIDKVLALMAKYRVRTIDVRDLMQETADIINKSFSIKEVTIGLRSPQDGKYRYEVMSGLRKDAWEAHAGLVYDLAQFTETGGYHGRQISKRTMLFLGEDQPYVEGEEDTFNRPILLKAKRRADDDCIEGDYLNVHILGKDDEMLGWVEISGTRDGKFPDPVTLWWIELLSELVAFAIQSEWTGRVTASGEDRVRKIAWRRVESR
jgi:hypothetical protein